MKISRLRFTAEAYAIRAKSWLRTILSVLGIGLVLVGSYNLLWHGDAILYFYRDLLPLLARAQVFGSSYKVVHVADVALIGIGAATAWWS